MKCDACSNDAVFLVDTRQGKQRLCYPCGLCYNPEKRSDLIAVRVN